MELTPANERLEGARPEERLGYAVETFGSDLPFTSSVGAEKTNAPARPSRSAKTNLQPIRAR